MAGSATLDDIVEAPAAAPGGGTAHLDDIATPENLPSSAQFQAAHEQHVEQAIGAAPPQTAWQKLKEFILGNPHAAPGQTDTPIGRALGISYEAPVEPHTPTTDLPMVRATAFTPSQPTTVPGGIAQGAAQLAEGLTTAPNLLMAAGSGGLGMLGRISSLLPRGVSVYFGAQMLRDAYDQSPEVRKAWDAGDAPGVAAAVTKLVGSGAMGALALNHSGLGGKTTIYRDVDLNQPVPGKPSLENVNPLGSLSVVNKLRRGGEGGAGAGQGESAGGGGGERLEPTRGGVTPEQAAESARAGAEAVNTASLEDIDDAATRDQGSGGRGEAQGGGANRGEPPPLPAGNGSVVAGGLPDQGRGGSGGGEPEPAPGSEGGNLERPDRRVSGSINVPLNEQGRQEMDDLGQQTAGQWTRINYAPNDRGAESAQILAQQNPGAQVNADQGLKPWSMGEHEGQPVETERDAIAARIRDTPDGAPPGQHPDSTEPGEPFNAAKDRTIQQLQTQAASFEPVNPNTSVGEGERQKLILGFFDTGQPGITVEGNLVNPRMRSFVYRDEHGKPQGFLSFYLNDGLNDVAPPEHGLYPGVYVSPELRRTGIATKLYDAAKQAGFDLSRVSGTEATPDGAAFINARRSGQRILNIASGRTLRMVDSWLRNGAPEDGSIDVDHMTREGDWHQTGDLYRAGPNGLEPVESADQPGIYYARHGATDFNGGPIQRQTGAVENAPPTAPEERGPGWVGNIPTSEIHADPARFQFKQNVGQGGAGEEFRDVRRFDPEKAGIVSVWRDPADGKTYVVNGHHRLEMRERIPLRPDEGPEKTLTVRYLDAADAKVARTKGALINISEGRGDALDAAKVFRDSGLGPEQLEAEGVSLKGEKARQGLLLANLDPYLFSKTVSGEIPVERASILGSVDPADQRPLYETLQQSERGGKRVTNAQLQEMIRLTPPRVTGTQESLFGSQEVSRSLIQEKAEVSDYVRKRLGQERKLFAAVGSDAAAGRLSETGNVIRAGENAQVAERTGRAEEIYGKLSKSPGAINDALDRAAAELANGEPSNAVKERAYRDIKAGLLEEVRRYAGAGEVPAERLEGDGRGGADQAGAGERDRRSSNEGPSLSERVGSPGPDEKPEAQAVPRTGAQLVGTLRVNRAAADVLREAYSFAKGTRVGAFDGAAASFGQVRRLLRGLGGLARAGNESAAAIAAELRKASGGGLRGVAIAGPESESHEQLHFAVDRLQIDSDGAMQHARTRLAAMEARSRGLATGSDARVLREVLTRIANNEHTTVKLSEGEADGVAANILAHSVQDESAVATLKELAHERFKDTIGNAGTQRRGAGQAGEEPGPPGDRRARSGGAGRDRGAAPDEGGEEEEGPELSSRGPQPSLFGDDSDKETARDAALDRDKLSGERLTAQFQAPLTREEQLKKLRPGEKPAQTGFFEQTPEKPQMGLFGGERGAAQESETASWAQSLKLAKSGSAVGFTSKGDTVTASYLPKTKRWSVGVAGETGMTSLGDERNRTFPTVEQARDYAASLIDPTETHKRAWWNVDNIPKPKAGERGAISGDMLGLGGAKKLLDEDVIPAAKTVAAGWEEAKDGIQKIVAPTARGESAMLTGLSLRQRMAQFTRRYDQGFERLKDARKFFDGRSSADNFKFIDNIEHARDQGDDNLNAIARTFRQMMDQRRREVQALGEGELERFYKNYFPHIFERPEGASKIFDSWFGRNRSLEGPKSFLKHRDFPTFKEALEAGLKPVSDNPVDLIMMKAREMDRYLLAHKTLRDLADQGIAKRVTGQQAERSTGQLTLRKVEDVVRPEDLPPNFVRINDPVGGGRWYAEEGAAQVMNNFLSPGLRERNGAWRVILGLSNVMNQANLGLSAFHLRAVTVSAMANRAGLGFVKAMEGHPADAAWHVLTSPAAPFIDYLKGSRMLHDWYKPGSEGAPIAAMTDALMKGGGRAGQPAEYRSQAISSMLKQWKRGNWIGAGLRSPLAAIEFMSKPLMENIVPRMKLGAFADIAGNEIARLGPGARVQDVQKAMAQAWDHVENRMGEMTYDDLFWNRTFKDTMHLMVRSVGWNLGDLREMASAGGAAKQLLTLKRPVDPHGLGFVLGYAFTAATIGAMMQYLHTGQGPRELKDYFWPKREDGRRYVSAPYVKDAYNMARDPTGTAIHKTGPLVNTLGEMITNRDYYDRPIRNLDDPLVKQLAQEAEFVGRQFLPFTLQEAAGPKSKAAQREAIDEKAHPEHYAEHFLGVQPAPAALQPGYKAMSDKRLSR